MSTGRQTALVATCFVASLTMATAIVEVPQALRIALGVPIVFLLPGFAIVCAVLPAERLSRSERLLASLGLSLAMTACTTVLLGALPIGLSKPTLAVVLGGSTVLISIYAWFRTHLGYDIRPKSERRLDGIRD
jgi:uncharacterized membrane protein